MAKSMEEFDRITGSLGSTGFETPLGSSSRNSSDPVNVFQGM
jgi:hypothetical protein